MHEKYKKFQCVNPKCDFAFWKIMGGRQFEPAEAETLLTEREIGPLEGFRSRIGRPFSAKLKLTDANDVEFDFGPRLDDDGAEAPDFTGQTPLGPCPKCSNQVFETPNAYVCERAVGPDKTCDFRSGRTILQRPIERAQMEKLLTTGKTDLLQFVSARTRRPFSAFLARQKDGSVGFEFEPKDPNRKGRPQRGGAPVRVLGPHPRNKAPVELHAGRYGPYVKHGDVNATLPDKDKMDTLTLEEAVALLDEKAGKSGGAIKPRKSPARPRAAKAPAAAEASEPAAAARRKPATSGTRKPAAGAARKPTTRSTAATCRATGARRSACLRHRQAQGDEGARKVEIAPPTGTAGRLTKRRSESPVRAAARGPS